jgi:Protein of unknown function (DUF2510)
VEPQGTSIAAGWYPNPEGDGLRFWDGRGWSTLKAETELLESGSGGRFVVTGADPHLDYSYQAVARLTNHRRPLPGSEGWAAAR